MLATEGSDADASTVKTLLAIVNNPNRREAAYHIVAEIRDTRNFEVAKLVAGPEVELVLVGDLISRIIAQTCRQSGRISAAMKSISRRNPGWWGRRSGRPCSLTKTRR